jgi:hypothetical protein
LGDSFDVSITAMPYFQNGAIRFTDVVVDTKNMASTSAVCGRSLTSTLRSQFAYKVADDATKILPEKRGIYRTERIPGFGDSRQRRRAAPVRTWETWAPPPPARRRFAGIAKQK